jgi:hypothetical protein
MTADVRRSPRRGTTSACALKAYAPEAGTRDRCMHSGDASFARSFDTCTLILTMHRRRKPRWWGVRVGITVGKTHACGRNLHWGFRERTAHGSPRVTASAREMAWHVRKGRRSRPPSLRGSRELGFGCPHVEIALQKLAGDVWSQIRSANALQKGRSGSSERGPSSGRTLAGDTVGRRVERNDESRVGLTAKGGRGPAQGSGWREIVIQRLSHRQKRCGGRGTGAVTATGSYEESLPMEGIPDHHEASAFTRRRRRWSWRSPHPPTRTNPFKRRTYGQLAAPAKAGEA